MEREILANKQELLFLFGENENLSVFLFWRQKRKDYKNNKLTIINKEPKMTLSEEITGLISKKFFLNQYIYNDIYVMTGKQECEFCDCLLEFGDVYICIQIKERNSKATGSLYKWFNDKVRGVAKDQLKKTVKYFNDRTNTIFSKSSELCIDRSKSLIPVIVFVNADISLYDRIVYSTSLQTSINIFSFSDFKAMLENLLIPYDIILYLEYRSAFNNDDRGKIIFDDVDKTLTILSRPKNEDDYAAMFLLRNYYKSIIERDIKEEYVKFYNTILYDLNAQNGYKRDNFIEGFLHVDYERADSISRKWIEFVDYAKAETYKAPFIFEYKNIVYMFFCHPQNISQETFQYRLNLCLTYYKHKHNYIVDAYILEFSNQKDDNYSVKIYDIDMKNEAAYKNFIDDAKKVFENN